MKVKKDQSLATEAGGLPPPCLQAALQGRSELPCAEAFEIAGRTGCRPEEVGHAADRMNIRLTRCQLGLFGYTPNKKIVAAAAAVAPELEQAIRAKLTQERLPCRDAWALAEAFGLPKPALSAACEALGVKIKPCQLGAF